ncbi:hypothetical protein EMIT0P291_50161 [Pseudomonas sp. IT-P291]
MLSDIQCISRQSYRYREQARSHRYSVRNWNRVASFKSFRAHATGAILDSSQLPQGG